MAALAISLESVRRDLRLRFREGVNTYGQSAQQLVEFPASQLPMANRQQDGTFHMGYRAHPADGSASHRGNEAVGILLAKQHGENRRSIDNHLNRT
jgi:hypothetical protein